ARVLSKPPDNNAKAFAKFQLLTTTLSLIKIITKCYFVILNHCPASFKQKIRLKRFAFHDKGWYICHGLYIVV
ncbi:MAG: hypothetical protein AAB067_00560, partial [Planctomycetota bacterium]